MSVDDASLDEVLPVPEDDEELAPGEVDPVAPVPVAVEPDAPDVSLDDELDEPEGDALELDPVEGTTVVDEEEEEGGVDRSAALRSPQAESAAVVPATSATMSRRFMGGLLGFRGGSLAPAI